MLFEEEGILSNLGAELNTTGFWAALKQPTVRTGYILFGVVLLGGAVLRLLAILSYPPALLWDDSWMYIYGTTLPGGFAPDKPNGYMGFLGLLGGGRHLGLVTSLQHLAGLIGGVLLFMAMQRQAVNAVVAALAAGVVLLDGYAIALEHHVLAEALFTLLVIVWAYCAIAAPRTWQWAIVAGAVLVAAISVRAAGIFLIPVWLIYGLWAFRGLPPKLTAISVVVFGVAGIMTAHSHFAGGFGLTQMSGWLMYGRIFEIADCSGRSVPEQDLPLCPSAERHVNLPDPYSYALFDMDSPTNRIFGDLYELPTDERKIADARLLAFSKDVIIARPLPFLGLIVRDTVRYLVPGQMSESPGYDATVTFPRTARPIDAIFEQKRDYFTPGYVPPPQSPQSFLPTYADWVNTPRWLLALSLIGGLAALALNLTPAGRRRLIHGPATLLLTGGGLSLLVGSALNHFEVRFLIPAAPLIIAGGAVAISDLIRAFATKVGDRPHALS